MDLSSGMVHFIRFFRGWGSFRDEKDAENGRNRTRANPSPGAAVHLKNNKVAGSFTRSARDKNRNFGFFFLFYSFLSVLYARL